MSLLRPTRLHVVRPDLAAEVATPAHDVLTPRARQQLLDHHPHSFLHVDLAAREAEDPATHPGADLVRRWIADGVFRALPEPTFAVHELRDGEHRQRGLVGEVPVSAYSAGRIRPHEATSPDLTREVTRAHRALALSASPVSLTVHGHPDLAALLDEVAAAEPTLDFRGHDGVDHRVWPVTSADLRSRLRHAIAAVQQLYVIDGHHRCMAMAELARTSGGSPEPRLLGIVFPDDQLRVSAYHRPAARPATSPDDLLAAAPPEDDPRRVLHPIPVTAIEGLADRGVVLPAKTTYVTPKVGSGTFLRPWT